MRIALSVFTFLWAVALYPAMVSAENGLPVLAIDYPPFTSTELPDHGLSFAALVERSRGSNIAIEPSFLPPARVSKHIAEGRWCASFYPPPADSAAYDTVPLGSKIAKIGLFRQRMESPFVWDQLSDLKGKTIGITSQFAQGQTRESHQLHEAGFDLAEVHSLRQAFDLLRRQRVDYVFSAEEAGHYYLDQLNLNPDHYQFSESLISQYPLQVWINPRCDLAKALRDHLKSQE